MRHIWTVYPCCGGRCLLRVIAVIPRQNYDRRCPECGTRFLIERRSTGLRGESGWIDVLSWSDKATRLYTRRYG